jgi:hypothetical protein
MSMLTVESIDMLNSLDEPSDRTALVSDAHPITEVIVYRLSI